MKASASDQIYPNPAVFALTNKPPASYNRNFLAAREIIRYTVKNPTICSNQW